MREFDAGARRTSWRGPTASSTRRSTPSCEAFPGMLELLRAARRRGPARSGSSAPSATTSSSSRSTPLGFGDTLDVVVGSDEAPRGKPHPDQILLALERLGADPDADRLRRRRALRHRRGEGGRRARGRRHLGRHPHARADGGGGPGRGRRHGRRALCRPLTDGARSRAPRAPRPLPLRVPRPRRAVGLRRGVRPALRRARRARGGAPRARHARLADAARRRAAVGPVPEGPAPRADGLAREGDDRGGAASSGPTTCASGSAPTSRSPT